MDNKQIHQSMVSCAEGYSTLILNSINAAITLDIDMDTLKKILDEWIQIRHTIICELSIV